MRDRKLILNLEVSSSFADIVAFFGSALDIVDTVLAMCKVYSKASMIGAFGLDEAKARVAVVVCRTRFSSLLGDALLESEDVLADLAFALGVSIARGAFPERAIRDGVGFALFGAKAAGPFAVA